MTYLQTESAWSDWLTIFHLGFQSCTLWRFIRNWSRVKRLFCRIRPSAHHALARTPTLKPWKDLYFRKAVSNQPNRRL